MNKKVENYIQNLENKIRKQELAQKPTEIEKNKFMLNAGLYNKVYSPDNIMSAEYPEFEVDEETKGAKYFRKEAIQVSDEEYIKLVSLTTKANLDTKERPIIVGFRVFMWLTLILGIVSSIMYYNLSYYNGYHGNDVFGTIMILAATAIATFILYGIKVALKVAYSVQDKLNAEITDVDKD